MKFGVYAVDMHDKVKIFLHCSIEFTPTFCLKFSKRGII